MLLSDRPQDLGAREVGAMISSAASLPAIIKGVLGTFGMECAVLSNIQNMKSLRDQLLKCTQQAAVMLQSGAYLHHYNKNGVSTQTILDALIATIHLLKF